MDKILFVELLSTMNAHGRVTRKGFASLDLSEGIPKVLYTMQVCEGVVQKQLAEICQIKESTLTVLLKRMEALGFIRKEPVYVSGGKRAYGIYYTEVGRKKADDIRVLMEEIDEEAMNGFSEEEMEQFFSYLDRIRNNLDAYQEKQ